METELLKNVNSNNLKEIINDNKYIEEIKLCVVIEKKL